MSQVILSEPKPSSTKTNNYDERAQPRKTSDLSQGPGLLEMVAGDEPEDPEHLFLTAKSSSVINFYPDWCRCLKCLLRSDDVSESDIDRSCWQQFTEFFECPPRGTLGRILVFIFLVIPFWGLLYYLFKPMSEVGKEEHDINLNPAWTRGPLFALLVIEVTGLFTGVLLKRFLNFPALLGPLVLGIIYNNVQSINVFELMKDFEHRNCSSYKIEVEREDCDDWAKHSVNNWVKPIRMIALAIILTRAGLELSPKQLKKLKGIVPLLAFGPCLVEACTCAGLNFLFFNYLAKGEKMSLSMCFVGGFALAAVSPAVVVPGALSLKRMGFGVGKGVPTLLIAASSIDDVLAISIYSIALGLAIQSEGLELWKTYSGGLIGIGIGVIHGSIFGMILHFVPPRKSRNKPVGRILLLLLVNIVSVLAYENTYYSSAGSISVLVSSFVAGFGWRSQPHWKRPMHKIEGWLAHLWVLWIPLIFGTIGKEIDFRGEAFQSEILGKTFGVIFISLTVRCFTAYFIVSCGTGFNTKERLFIALSWIPKATVQAALAPLVLTRASESNNKNARETAVIVVNVAILAVLITAPIGCILMMLTGPRLLERFHSPQDIIEEEFPNGGGIDPSESTFGLIAANARTSIRPGYGSNQDIRKSRIGSMDVAVIAESVKTSQQEMTRNIP